MTVSNAATSPVIQGGAITSELHGVPMMVSYGRDWSCARVRFQVWLNMCRMLDRKSSSGLAAIQALRTGYVEQIAQCRQLDIRLVNPLGQGLTPIRAKSKGISCGEAETNFKLEFLGRLLRDPRAAKVDARVKELWITKLISDKRSDINRELGMVIPADKSVTFGETTLIVFRHLYVLLKSPLIVSSYVRVGVPLHV